MLATESTSVPSARTPKPAIARLPIYQNGAIIEWQLPVQLAPGSVTTEEGLNVVFHQFAVMPMTTGPIFNFFVRADNATPGSTIRARLEIIEKEVQGGRKFLSVDLHPVDLRTPVTHRLMVQKPGRIPEPNWMVFTTIQMRGCYLSLVEYDEIGELAGGDGQLERYLRDGWRIHSAGEKIIKLTKPDSDRMLDHHRPKQKGDRRVKSRH